MDKARKLNLNKETLRKLEEAQASAIAGGTVTSFCAWLPKGLSALLHCTIEDN
jgi:DNA-binding Xre family transcriptional regulator